MSPSDAPTPSATASTSPSILAGTDWLAIRVAGRPAVPGKEPTAFFTQDRIMGAAGCNDYDGSYQLANVVLSMSGFIWTAVGCNGAVGEVERLFDDALRGAASASIDPAGRLVVDGSGGSITFVPAGEPSPN